MRSVGHAVTRIELGMMPPEKHQRKMTAVPINELLQIAKLGKEQEKRKPILKWYLGMCRSPS